MENQLGIDPGESIKLISWLEPGLKWTVITITSSALTLTSFVRNSNGKHEMNGSAWENSWIVWNPRLLISHPAGHNSLASVVITEAYWSTIGVWIIFISTNHHQSSVPVIPTRLLRIELIVSRVTSRFHQPTQFLVLSIALLSCQPCSIANHIDSLIRSSTRFNSFTAYSVVSDCVTASSLLTSRIVNSSRFIQYSLK